MKIIYAKYGWRNEYGSDPHTYEHYLKYYNKYYQKFQALFSLLLK